MCTPRPLGKSGTDRAESIRRIPQRGVIATAWPKSQSRFRKEKAALTNMPPRVLKTRTVLLFSDLAHSVVAALCAAMSSALSDAMLTTHALHRSKPDAAPGLDATPTHQHHIQAASYVLFMVPRQKRRNLFQPNLPETSFRIQREQPS